MDLKNYSQGPALPLISYVAYSATTSSFLICTRADSLSGNRLSALLSFLLFLFLLPHNLRLKLRGGEGSAWLLRYTQPCQFRFQLLRVCSFGDVATFGNSAFRL